MYVYMNALIYTLISICSRRNYSGISGLYGNSTSAQNTAVKNWDLPMLTRVENGSVKMANNNVANSSTNNTAAAGAGGSGSIGNGNGNGNGIAGNGSSGSNQSGHDINQDMMNMNLNSMMAATAGNTR
jgi:hypothetical protein